jgi:transketolase
MIGMEGFGASAPGERLFQEFKLTPEQVAQAARQLVSSTRASGRRSE